jgi:FMN phosphatase YigB (HAD superfamily)
MLLSTLRARTPAPSSVGAEADLFSCDVFDTLITRVVGNPSSLFLLLGRRLVAAGLIHSSAEAFNSARREANRRAHANGAGPRPLSAIYQELQFTLGLDDVATAAILEAEIVLEKELSRAIPGAAERLDRARNSGMRVAFLSDMYLDTAVMRSLLETHGLIAGDEPLYISCEMGCGKLTGEAFHRLSEREAVPLHRVLHYGNDPQRDVAAAVRAGARAEAFPAGNLNRYEQILESHSQHTDGLASLMSGASRLARLSVAARTPGDAALRDAAAGVGAPALVSYVLWVLLRARAMGLRRLYFVSRDGHVLRLIAQRLADRLNLDMELRYLHGGRKAWYVPALEDTRLEDLFWAVDYASADSSVASFLRRIGIEAAEVEEHLVELELPRSTWTLPRPPAEYATLWSIPQHGAIRELVLERARGRRAAVLGYFEQEGLLDDSDWALVDVGWSGRLLGAMNGILQTQGAAIPAAFFFARFATRERYSFPTVSIVPFMGDYHNRRGLCGRINELFLELFCGANHGTTVDYQRGAAGWEPVLSSQTHDALAEWGVGLVHDTITAFTDHLWLEPGTIDMAADMRPAIIEVFQNFIKAPTSTEAQAWGSYPFECGRNGTISATLATPLNLGQLPRILRTGGGEDEGRHRMVASQHTVDAATHPRHAAECAGTAAARWRCVARGEAAPRRFRRAEGDVTPRSKVNARGQREFSRRLLDRVCRERVLSPGSALCS